MNCEIFNERISEFADNELAQPLADEMRAHLESCEPCAAEFHAVKNMSKLISQSSKPKGQGPTWADIAARLDNNSTAPTLMDQPPQRNRRAQIATILSLAAALLFAIGLPFAMQSKTGTVNQASVAAIDLQSVVELFSTSPEAAIDSLANKYAGVPAHQHEADAEYKPIASKSLPNGMQLVSTRVMPMPFCNCPEDKCQCGPGECNCVACICERPDGSRFLIVENCNSYGVSFGNLQTEMVQRDGRKCEQIRSKDVLAVSWEVNDRHLTAIGLTDEHEGNSLLAASFADL